MKFLDLTFPTPAENLAGDEALLDWREESGGDEILRFWESPETFVVVGYANKIEAEVNTGHCEAGKIPILRRCSGGGTVLQGRGCLNYALILEIAGNPALANISSANQYIMERNRAAVQAIAEDSRIIKVQGHTDLAWANKAGLFRKFSGNSQRRHKNFLLFHGTFLLDFDLRLVTQYLKFPSRQPDYRSSRSHRDFLANLNLSADKVKAAMQKIWQADQSLMNPPMNIIHRLTREKYVTGEWNSKF
jgi:lipoate---protein ligase